MVSGGYAAPRISRLVCVTRPLLRPQVKDAAQAVPALVFALGQLARTDMRCNKNCLSTVNGQQLKIASVHQADAYYYRCCAQWHKFISFSLDRKLWILLRKHHESLVTFTFWICISTRVFLDF